MKTIKWKMYVAIVITLITFAACEKEPTTTVDSSPILLGCNFAADDTTLIDYPEKPVDYIIDCKVPVDGILTINPGVVIQFKTDAGLNIKTNGALVAEGTSSKKIILEGTSSVKGSWAGIIVFSNNVINSLKQLEIRHGGGDDFNSNADMGNIIVYAGGRLTLDNVLCEMSATSGLVAPYYNSNIAVSNSTFTGNTNEPVELTGLNAQGLEGDNDFTGNGNDVIKVKVRAIESGNMLWQKLNVPYYVYGGVQNVNGGTLTIEAGAELVFGADCGLSVIDGSITAIGTASQPIVFTGLTKQAGAWKGIYFETNDLQNQLDYVTIEYSGSGAFNSNGDLGAAIVYASSYLSISNSTLRNGSSPCGIDAHRNGAVLVESNNSITGFTTDICY